MTSEIVVPETPNWLNELEEKREKRLKARLGHEAGAGAPCLKCLEKCPGLDLHFWRKACKICRCPKEEHDVPDDDIYGWTQFQLLGSKPNKIKTKIALPGKKDEVELEWAPKGQKETIDDYLKTLPPESLPVKGSQAAQERKQMLQKQIPVHDIDPSLCHELNEEEVKKMEEYIAHVKNNSVGVGQIVNLSNIIKANLHNISPQEAHIIASHYAKGIPFSEIVKLQSGLAKNLGNLTLKEAKNRKNICSLPQMQSGIIKANEDIQNPTVTSKYKDIVHPWYTKSSPSKGALVSQYSQGFKSGQYPEQSNYKGQDYPIDEKLLQGTNFDPSKTPSQFLKQSNNQNPRGLLYGKTVNNVAGSNMNSPRKASEAFISNDDPLMRVEQGFPNVPVPQYGFENPLFYQDIPNPHTTTVESQNVSKNPNFDPQAKTQNQINDTNGKFSEFKREMPRGNSPLKNPYGSLPRYTPNRSDVKSDTKNPKSPKNLKDLMYSTYEASEKAPPNSNPALNTFNGIPGENKYENPNLININDPMIYGDQLDPSDKPNFDLSTSPNAGRNYTNAHPEKSNPGIGKLKKPLSHLQPAYLNVPEDYVEPHMINIGAIQDINPEIKGAITQLNPGYSSDNEDNVEHSPDSIRELINNIKFPDCHYCKKSFKENEFAVTIDRANVLFHAQCFKCAGCNQSLADNIYFYHKETNNVYCGRDYAKIKGYPRCAACDELIFTKEYCLAENSTFHLKHFCCFQCDTPLAGQDYTLEDEKPYCLPCYETSKAAKCGTCLNVIKPDERGCQLNGVHFHAEDRCFCCIRCSKPLMGKKLLLRNEKLFCSYDCFEAGKI